MPKYCHFCTLSWDGVEKRRVRFVRVFNETEEFLKHLMILAYLTRRHIVNSDNTPTMDVRKCFCK